MRRKKSPLVATVLLGLFSGWMASCSDDESTTCVAQETRLCAGVGRCTGVQACLPDGSGWSDCDCSGPPREDGTGGTTGTTEGPSSLVGRACAQDAECGTGLTCLTSASNAFFGGGAPNGYCTATCTQDAQCAAIDPDSACIAPAAGAEGICTRICFSQDQGSLAENKCLGRHDLACNSEAFRGLAEASGSRQIGWCFPQCAGDEDCGGRRCDLARGVCLDEQQLTTGEPIGSPCTTNEECAGRLCVARAPGEAFCSGPCVFGQPIGCGYGVSVGTSAREAGCVSPQVLGILGIGSEGLQDVGFCGELCDETADCTQADRGWVCQPSEGTSAIFKRAGICNVPQPAADAGVDAGDDDASAPSVLDAG